LIFLKLTHQTIALPMLKLPSHMELQCLPKKIALNYSSPSFIEYFSLMGIKTQMGILANK